MAYNSYYPVGYQPAYAQQMQQAQQAQQQNNMIWVVGEGGADSYLVAPGQTVQLWDSTAPIFYLKSADAMGRPSKRVFDYTERNAVQMPKIEAQKDFASKDDVDYLKREIEALRAKFADLEGVTK